MGDNSAGIYTGLILIFCISNSTSNADSNTGVDLGGIPLSRPLQIFRRNTRFVRTVIRPDYQFLPRFGDPMIVLASLD